LNIEQIFDRAIPEPNSGCWLWEGARDNRGYGAIWTGQKHARTHRISYEITKGSIPVGMHVCHKCDVTSCINPDHLFIGSPRENAVDMASKFRAGGQKLSAKQVKEIQNSQDTYARLAGKYGVSISLIAYHKSKGKL
jgi:hypothetical protein